MGMYGNTLLALEDTHLQNESTFFDSLEIVTEGTNLKDVKNKLHEILTRFINFLKQKMIQMKRFFEQKMKSVKEKIKDFKNKIKKDITEDVELEYYEFFDFEKYFKAAYDIIDKLEGGDITNPEHEEENINTANHMSEVSQNMKDAVDGVDKLLCKITLKNGEDVTKYSDIVEDINKKYNASIGETADDVVEMYTNAITGFEELDKEIAQFREEREVDEELKKSIECTKRVAAAMMPASKDLLANVMQAKSKIMFMINKNIVAFKF